MTKKKASTTAEGVLKKPRREETTVTDGGPNVGDETAVTPQGRPSSSGAPLSPSSKGAAPSSHRLIPPLSPHSGKVSSRPGPRKAPCPVGPSVKVAPHDVVKKKLEVSKADLAKMKELYLSSTNQYKNLEARLDELGGTWTS
uniref:Uncharacterized protein n=1 Tax=Leersia perrieri TaxID=77586 RepID=A0A0D9WY76_9ORYZ